MNNRSISLIAILALVVVSSAIFIASAQYYTSEQIANITVPSTGTVHVDSSSTVGNLSMDIVAAPGTTGSVSTATYQGNPQPDATVPANTELSNFVVVTFNIPEDKFTSATLVFTYDSNIAAPTLYKLSADGTSFVEMTNAVVDTTAHTITVTLTSTTDPLFAIGQAAASPTPTENSSDNTLLYAAVAIVVIVIIAVVGIFLVKRKK